MTEIRKRAGKKINSKYTVRFIKDAIATADTRNLAEKDLKAVQNAEIENVARKNFS